MFFSLPFGQHGYTQSPHGSPGLHQQAKTAKFALSASIASASTAEAALKGLAEVLQTHTTLIEVSTC
jgi:hypothetical protein